MYALRNGLAHNNTQSAHLNGITRSHRVTERATSRPNGSLVHRSLASYLTWRAVPRNRKCTTFPLSCSRPSDSIPGEHHDITSRTKSQLPVDGSKSTTFVGPPAIPRPFVFISLSPVTPSPLPLPLLLLEPVVSGDYCYCCSPVAHDSTRNCWRAKRANGAQVKQMEIPGNR